MLWIGNDCSWVRGHRMGMNGDLNSDLPEFVTPASYVSITHMQLSCLWAEPVLAATLATQQRKSRAAKTCSKGHASCPFSSHLFTRHPDGLGLAGWPRISVWGNSIHSSSMMTKHFSRRGREPRMCTAVECGQAVPSLPRQSRQSAGRSC